MDAYIQPTVSGKVESGLFGCYRNGGARFHEGVDLKSIQRGPKQKPKDAIFAIMPGRVVYINKIPGNSSYGRYVVIEHDHLELPLTSLYAHLGEIEPHLRVGQQVHGGDTIGIMGHSASTPIPVSRAHLHLEIGLKLSNRFDSWYKKQQFGTPNKHGVWNGMNLMGIDPLDFFKRARDPRWVGEVLYIKTLPTAFIFKISTRVIPDFIRRYPQLLNVNQLPERVYGWKVECTWFGFPKNWTPIEAPDSSLGKPGTLKLIMCDSQLLLNNRGAKMIAWGKNGAHPGRRLLKMVGILFEE